MCQCEIYSIYTVPYYTDPHLTFDLLCRLRLVLYLALPCSCSINLNLHNKLTVKTRLCRLSVYNIILIKMIKRSSDHNKTAYEFCIIGHLKFNMLNNDVDLYPI